MLGEIVALTFAHTVLCMAIGFFVGRAYSAGEQEESLDDLTYLLAYLDPDGSKRRAGKRLMGSTRQEQIGHDSELERKLLTRG